MAIRTDWATGEKLNADDYNDVNNAILQNAHNIIELYLENYFAGNATPFDGLFFDGFSDNTKADVTNQIIIEEALVGGNTLTMTSTASMRAGMGLHLYNSLNQQEVVIDTVDSATQITITGTLLANYTVTAFDIGNLSFVRDFDTTNEGTSAQGIFFAPSGLSMYAALATGDVVAQYSLTTPWDTNTATVLGTFSVASQDATVRDLTFQDDGSRFFIVGSSTDKTYQYDLGTNWLITSGSFSGTFDPVAAVGGGHGGQQGIFIGAGGTIMATCGTDADSVYGFDLATPWDINTATYSGDIVSVNATDTDPTSVYLSEDGTRLWFLGNTNDTVYEHTLSTAFSISTKSAVVASFDVSGQTTGAAGLTYANNGKIQFIASEGDAKILTYNLKAADIKRTSAEIETSGRQLRFSPSITVGDDKKVVYYSTITTFQDPMENARVWLTRGRVTTGNLSIAASQDDGSLIIASNLTSQLASGDTVDLMDANNLNRERFTITADPTYTAGDTTIAINPTIVLVGGYGTTAVVERVDAIPQISVVDIGDEENMQSMVYEGSEVDFANNETEDEYSITVTANEDTIIKVIITRNTPVAVYAKKYGVAYNE